MPCCGPDGRVPLATGRPYILRGGKGLESRVLLPKAVCLAGGVTACFGGSFFFITGCFVCVFSCGLPVGSGFTGVCPSLPVGDTFFAGTLFLVEGFSFDKVFSLDESAFLDEGDSTFLESIDLAGCLLPPVLNELRTLATVSASTALIWFLTPAFISFNSRIKSLL